MNTRIKKLRKELGLTAVQFGEKVGVTRSAISNIENDNRSVTEQMFKLIVSEFNVNEDWLRYGKGQMFDEKDFTLEQYAIENDLTEKEFDILKAYFSIPKDERTKVLNHFIDNYTEIGLQKKNDEDSVEILEDEYKKSILNSVSKNKSTQLNTIEDINDTKTKKANWYIG